MEETTKVDIENPKTKIDYEMRDFSWQNIKGWAIIIGLVYVIAKISKKTNK
jgi:hypothetical protein